MRSTSDRPSPGPRYWLATTLALPVGGLVALWGLAVIGDTLLPNGASNAGRATAILAVAAVTTFLVWRLSALRAMTAGRRAAWCLLSLVLQSVIATGLLVVVAAAVIYVDCHTRGCSI
jgi:hypothetical protein